MFLLIAITKGLLYKYNMVILVLFMVGSYGGTIQKYSGLGGILRSVMTFRGSSSLQECPCGTGLNLLGEKRREALKKTN
jgi:hypothetical protein